MLSEKEVLEQSKSAFRQWEDLWKKNCAENGKIYNERGSSQKKYLFVGKGRGLLCIANGPSFEDKINYVKENIGDGVDIACVDKCFCSLIEKDIIPQFVFIADASIDYKKWAEPYIEKTDDIILVANVNCNPDWTKNWRGDIVYYVNKDNIESEKIFMDISGCREVIPASSNVGNTVVVFSTQILGYDEYYLLGYDFCWGDDDNYYAFSDSEKRYWMSHYRLLDNVGRMVKTSNNLLFSAKWLTDFYNNVAAKMGIRFFNISGKGILAAPTAPDGIIKRKERKLTNEEKKHILMKRTEQIVITDSKQLEHFLKNEKVSSIIVNYIPQEVYSWLN